MEIKISTVKELSLESWIVLHIVRIQENLRV